LIRPGPLPDHALLATYRDAGAYTDCYATEVDDSVSQADYVEAFYCTWLFKIERQLLALFVDRPSSDALARELATGASEAFAAWTVEGRAADQLLLCDYQGRTRSWLMREPQATGGTRLYFGSAVVPVRDRNGHMRMGAVFRLLLGFHRLYSRLLLGAAVARLRR
jgi:hypothetical protein